MAYGNKEEVCKLSCEMCGKLVTLGEETTIFLEGDVVCDFSNELVPRPHWFCNTSCADKFRELEE